MRRQRLAILPGVLFVAFCSSTFTLAQTDDARSADSHTSEVPTVRSLPGKSHARVVSLSLVEGTVIERGPGSGKWVRAALETPIQEGVSIVTARHSFAEVQFENGSTVRLGELSRIDFTELTLAPRGGYVDGLRFRAGFVTIHMLPSRHDECVLDASGASLMPRGKTEFRTDLSRGHLRIEVFSGHVQVADSTHAEKLRKNQVLAYDYPARSGFRVRDAIQMDAWDKWVRARDRQADLAAYNNQSPGGLLYGWDELIPFGGMGAFPYGDSDDGF